MPGTQVFKIKRNDTLPPLQVSLKTRGNLNEIIPYNLSGVSAITFSLVDECKNLKIYKKEAIVYCYSGATLQYNWSLDDTDIAGKYQGEFELSFSGGGILSVPTQGGINIEILEDLNQF